MIIGVMGTIGSGKDVVVNYLVDKHGFKFISFGDMLREEFKKRKLKVTRESVISYQKDLLEKHGEDFLVKRVINKIKKNKWKNVAITGIRHPIDVRRLKEEFGEKFISIKVDARPTLRYKRMKKRGREDSPKNYLQFQKQDRLEFVNFNLKETFSYADFIVRNNSTLDSVYHKVEEILKTIKHKN